MDITEPVKQASRNFEERVQQQVEESTKESVALHRRVTAYIRANPGKCLLGAVVAGYIVGRIARRK